MKTKHAFILTLASCMLSTLVMATTWTVSNNPERPAQFTSIQEAIDAAALNDTILITGETYGSSTGGGSITLVKPLVFYGEAATGTGAFPTTTLSSTSIQITRFNPTLSASGSRFYGINFASSSSVSINGSFSGSQTGQRTMSDIIFERCRFSGSGNLSFSIQDGISDVTVRNCIFEGSGNPSFSGNGNLLSSIVFTNNIFSNSGSSFSGSVNLQGNVVVRNCLFLNNTNNAFSSISQLVLENNIFYRAEPTGCNTCTFNNNLTWLSNAPEIPYGNNLGSGNIVNQNPLFVNYPELGANWSIGHDYTLQDGSPAIGTGTNGTDMGLNSGNAPVSNIPRFPKIPGVTELNIPVSSVPVGGTLQINVQAVARD